MFKINFVPVYLNSQNKSVLKHVSRCFENKKLVKKQRFEILVQKTIYQVTMFYTTTEYNFSTKCYLQTYKYINILKLQAPGRVENKIIN